MSRADSRPSPGAAKRTSETVATCKVTIRNHLGLHARAATRLVECANQFNSEVWLSNGKRRVNGKSIMSLLLLAAGPGMVIGIETVGEDGPAALAALSKLIESGFGEPD